MVMVVVVVMVMIVIVVMIVIGVVMAMAVMMILLLLVTGLVDSHVLRRLRQAPGGHFFVVTLALPAMRSTTFCSNTGPRNSIRAFGFLR